jgi:5-methylcytosine-specific restriction protein A
MSGPCADWYNLQRWKRRSAQQLREHPLCVFCLQRGLVQLATVADHVTPHKGDWMAFLLGPLQSLCASCHSSAKRTQEVRGYSTEVGLDGYPTDPKHPAYKK